MFALNHFVYTENGKRVHIIEYALSGHRLNFIKDFINTVLLRKKIYEAIELIKFFKYLFLQQLQQRYSR